MNTKPLFSVVIPAAGSGTRFGPGDKLLTPLAGISVLARAVALFARRHDVGQIVLVTPRDRWDHYARELHTHAIPDVITFTEGGRERWESVLLGLRAVREQFPFVAIHDAARPLTPPSLIDAAFAAAVRVGGSVPVLAEPATLKRLAPDQLVTETVDRRGLYQAQTPQCFDRPQLLDAYQRLVREQRIEGVTDDAQVFEKNNRPVAGTPGSPVNLKITTADDIRLAEALLRL